MAYQAGQTVILNAEFKDVNNDLFDPTINSVEIYATDKSTVLETFSNNEWEKVSTGIYKLKYELPFGYPTIYHQWNITNDNIEDLRRQKIEITYV